MRSGEPAPDAIVGLWKDALAERVEVQPLSRGETEELLEAALGSQVEGSTLHRLFETTRGNPLFLRELVLGGLHAGSLAEEGGVWRWTGPFHSSPRLLDVVNDRLGRVDDGELEVLEVVADMKRDGLTLLLVTHEIGFARAVADRMLFMDQGAIIADGPPAEVIAARDNPRTRQFFDLILAR